MGLKKENRKRKNTQRLFRSLSNNKRKIKEQQSNNQKDRQKTL